MPKLAWLLLLGLIIPLRVSAESASPTNGITVAPALLTNQVGSKQKQTSTTIGVRNNFDVPITVAAVLNGFDVRNNALVPTIKAEKTLEGVVSLSPAEIVIPPGSSKNITVTVHDTPSLSPGGHYLSILLTETAAGTSVGTTQLTLRPAVSATLYVIKEDGAIRSIKATSLHLNHSLFSLPATANIEYFNTGNVPIVPRGVVQINRSSSESAITQGIVNSQSAPLYPNAKIRLQSTLQKLQTAHLPGHYKAVLQYRYDGQETSQQISQNFWYIPKTLIALILFSVTVVALLVWPENKRRLARYWHNARRPKKAPFIAPITPEKTSNKRQPAVRRKIDDIKKL